MGKKEDKYAGEVRAALIASLKSKNSDAIVGSLLGSSANVSDWISTGDYMLDLVLSNRMNGGIPVGRLTEISGGEGAGKTLLATYLMADTQKKRGIAVYIDTEQAASPEVMMKAGVDVDNMIYIQAGTTEDVFQAMDTVVTKVHRENSDKLITIVWDSVAATSTKAEVEGDFEAGRSVALQARLIGIGLRKLMPIVSKHKVCLVFINQLRTNIGVTFGDKKFTPGGKMVGYNASIRLRLEHFQQIKDKDKDLIGRVVKCDVKKNKIAPPTRSIYYTIPWGDEPGAWIDAAETMWDSAIRKAVFEKVTQQKYSFITSTDEKLEFTRKAFAELIKEENFLHEVKVALAAAYIITSKNVSSEDVTYDAAGEDG